MSGALTYTPRDMVSFTLAPLVLLPAVIAASLVPALSAAGTDPAVVLRGEQGVG